AEPKAADTQRICPALVVQGACAAPSADNEPCLDDRKVDRARLRITIDRRPGQNDCCAHDDSAEFPRINASKHCHRPEAASSQEAGGSISLLTGDGSVWRRHSTNSWTRAALEKMDAKPALAISNN